AVALMEGVVHAMFMTKLKATGVAVLALALLGVGGMAGYQGLSAQQGVADDRPGGASTSRQTDTTRPRTGGIPKRARTVEGLQAQLDAAKASLAQSQANVDRLQKALKDLQARQTAPRGMMGMGGGRAMNMRPGAAATDTEVTKTKVAVAKAEYDSAV